MKASLILVLFLAFAQVSWAKDYSFCQTYSQVELKERYKANFLNKDFRGCFQYTLGNDYSHVRGMISVSFGKSSKSTTAATTAQMTYQTFTAITENNKINTAFNSSVDQNLTKIRNEAVAAANDVSDTLSNANQVYQEDALPQLRENQKDLRLDSSLLDQKSSQIEKKIASLPTNSQSIGLPANSATNLKNLSPIDKEKQRWAGLKNKESMPFRSLEKISKAKNTALVDKLLKEMKAERYQQLGLTDKAEVSSLRQVQKYENSEDKLNTKLEFINRNPQLTSGRTPQELKLIKEISSEFKKESERNLVNGELAKANESIDTAYVALDLATSIPLISTARGVYELYSGKSLIDGHELDTTEKVAAATMLLIDLTPASVISRGTQFAGSVLRVGGRLVERQIVKAGFEEALKYGITNAELWASTANKLLTQGLIKYQTLKISVEHKLFFKFIDEGYFTSKMATNLMKFNYVSGVLAKEGIEASVGMEHYFSNLIHYEKITMNDESISVAAQKYRSIELKMNSVKPTISNNVVITRAAEKKFSPFNLTSDWFKANRDATHRFSMSGELGLYGVVGDDLRSGKIALSEARLTDDVLKAANIDTKQFSHSKVLDLTNPEVLNQLGLDLKDLLDDDITWSNIVGHIANINDYDAIISYGAQKKYFGSAEDIGEYVNYIILRGF